MAYKRKKKEIEPIEEIEELPELEEENEEPVYQYEPPPVVQKQLSENVEIMPSKDFEIHQNEIDIYIKSGEPVTVPRRFLQNLVTEKVIKNIPK